jgi:hypothetical protein
LIYINRKRDKKKKLEFRREQTERGKEEKERKKELEKISF